MLRTNVSLRLWSKVDALNQQRDQWSPDTLSIGSENGESKIAGTSNESLCRSSQEDAQSRILTLIKSDKNATSDQKAESILYLTKEAFEDFKVGRQSSKARKASAGTQTLLCTIADFLQSFSGIAEIVKAMDQQAGGLAYGTVMVLATVAVNKRKREEAIEEALEELSHAFPRLDTLNRIQELKRNPLLRALIVETFHLSILFCRETIDYLNGTSTHRVLRSLKPNELKMKTLANLRLKLLEVRKECEVILLGLVVEQTMIIRELRIDIGSIKRTGSETLGRVEDSQSLLKEDKEAKVKKKALSELRELLSFDEAENPHSSKTLSKVDEMLRREFSEQKIGSRRIVRPMTKSALTKDKAFAEWHQAKGSCVLLLGGRNARDDSSLQLNWLSWASVWVTRLVSETPCSLSVFCQSEYHMTNRTRRDFSHVLDSLIYQLAARHPEGFHSQRKLITEAVKGDEWQSADHSVVFDRKAELLKELMGEFPDDAPITVVIDRLDRCSWSVESDDDVDGLKPAVGALLSLIQKAERKMPAMKILLVMDDRPARAVAKQFDYVKGMTARLNWNQGANDNEV